MRTIVTIITALVVTGAVVLSPAAVAIAADSYMGIAAWADGSTLVECPLWGGFCREIDGTDAEQILRAASGEIVIESEIAGLDTSKIARAARAAAPGAGLVVSIDTAERHGSLSTARVRMLALLPVPRGTAVATDTAFGALADPDTALPRGTRVFAVGGGSADARWLRATGAQRAIERAARAVAAEALAHATGPGSEELWWHIYSPYDPTPPRAEGR